MKQAEVPQEGDQQTFLKRRGRTSPRLPPSLDRPWEPQRPGWPQMCVCAVAWGEGVVCVVTVQQEGDGNWRKQSATKARLSPGQLAQPGVHLPSNPQWVRPPERFSGMDIPRTPRPPTHTHLRNQEL